MCRSIPRVFIGEDSKLSSFLCFPSPSVPVCVDMHMYTYIGYTCVRMFMYWSCDYMCIISRSLAHSLPPGISELPAITLTPVHIYILHAYTCACEHVCVCTCMYVCIWRLLRIVKLVTCTSCTCQLYTI